MGGDLYVAEESQVGDFHQADPLQHLPLLFHFQLFAGLSDNGALGLDVYRNGVVPGGGHPANVLPRNRASVRGEKVHLVREANAHQGTPWHLGLSTRGGGTQPEEAMSRIPDNNSRVREMRTSSNGTAIRWRDFTK